jgi:hypothetical protein
MDPIVALVEFKGRLWVATSKGLFVKRENEDVFDPVEMIPAPEDQPSGFGCDA